MSVTATIEVISPQVTIPPAAYPNGPGFAGMGDFVLDANGNYWMASAQGYFLGGGDVLSITDSTPTTFTVPLNTGNNTATALAAAINAIETGNSGNITASVSGGGALVLTPASTTSFTLNATTINESQTLATLGLTSGSHSTAQTATKAGPYDFNVDNSFSFPASPVSILSAQTNGGSPTVVFDNQVAWTCAYDGTLGGVAATILSVGVAVMQITIVNTGSATTVVAVSPSGNLGSSASVTNDLQSILTNVYQQGPSQLPLPASSTTVVTYLAQYIATNQTSILDNQLPTLYLSNGTAVVCTVASETTNLVQPLTFGYPAQGLAVFQE